MNRLTKAWISLILLAGTLVINGLGAFGFFNVPVAESCFGPVYDINYTGAFYFQHLECYLCAVDQRHGGDDHQKQG